MNTIYEAPKETAKKIRKVLKKAFPETKFSVTTDVCSMGSSINVSWTDGPLDCQVSPLVNQFQAGYFDGMQDMYIPGSYTCPFDGMQYSGAKHLFTKRTLSAEYESRIHDYMQSYYTEQKQKNDYGYYQDFDYCDQKLYIESIITPDENMLLLSKAYRDASGSSYTKESYQAACEAIDAYMYEFKKQNPAIKHLGSQVIRNYLEYCYKPAESIPDDFDSLAIDGYELEPESIEHESPKLEPIAPADELSIDGYTLDDSAPIEPIKPVSTCATCGNPSEHIYCSYDCLPIEAPDEPSDVKDIYFKGVKIGYSYRLKHALKFVETYTHKTEKTTYELNTDLDAESQALNIFIMVFEAKLKALYPVANADLSVLDLDSAYIDLLPFMASKEQAYNLTIIASDPSDKTKLCIGHILTDGNGFTFADHAYGNISLVSASNLIEASIQALDQVSIHSKINRHLHLDFKTSDDLPVMVKSFDGSLSSVGRVFESNCTGNTKWYYYNSSTDLIESTDKACSLSSAIDDAIVLFKTSYAMSLCDQGLIDNKCLALSDVLPDFDHGVIMLHDGLFKFQGLQQVTLQASNWYDAIIEVLEHEYHLMPEALPEPLEIDDFDSLDLDIDGYSLEYDDTPETPSHDKAPIQSLKPDTSIPKLDPLNALYADFFKSQAWMVAA